MKKLKKKQNCQDLSLNIKYFPFFSFTLLNMKKLKKRKKELSGFVFEYWIFPIFFFAFTLLNMKKLKKKKWIVFE